MGIAKLRSDERIGLGVAFAAHVGLLLVLAINAAREPVRIPLPERMVVSLADDVGPANTAPNPVTEAQASVAPIIAPINAPQAVPVVEVAPAPSPSPSPSPAPAPAPAVQVRPEPVRVAPKPTPRNIPKPRVQPNRPPAPRAAPVRPTAPPKQPAPKAGGDRFADAFKSGLGSSDSADTGTPATTIGPQVKASLAQSVARQLKPHWQQPTGVDVEKLATTVEWDLNSDGSLKGAPRVVQQTGITASNQPQTLRHREQAIRAIRLAAPFKLPEQYYSGWKRLRYTFDWNLN